MTVHELRKNGYKVRVIHVREKLFKILKTTRAASYELEYSVDILENPKGGKTVVEISTPYDEHVFGIAYCNHLDNYNRKEGVKIALSRALEQLNHV